MELSKEQLLEIDKYLTASKVKYEDVKKELLDHFASILEVKLTENPNLNFRQQLENIHKSFGDKGFKELLTKKTKTVTKQFYKESLLELKSFFTAPKIFTISILFLGLRELMQWIEDKALFFNVLEGILIFLAFRLLFLVNIRNSKKLNFLALDITMSFCNSFYVAYWIFHFFVNFYKEPYGNPLFNHAVLIVFFLITLSYWCGEYVYYQKKNKINTLYKTYN